MLLIAKYSVLCLHSQLSLNINQFDIEVDNIYSVGPTQHNRALLVFSPLPPRPSTQFKKPDKEFHILT